MKKPQTETEKQYILQNRLKLTINEMSKHLQRNPKTIYSFLASHKLSYKRAVVFRNPNLTEREKEVMALVSRGLNNQQIIDKLVISLTTLKTHLSNIYSKYNLTGPRVDFSVQRLRAVLKFKETMFKKYDLLYKLIAEAEQFLQKVRSLKNV